MKTNFKKGFVNILGAILIGGLAVVAGAFLQKSVTYVSTPQVNNNQLAGAINYPTGGGTYKLASSISSTQTSVKLSSFKEPVSGTLYTMTYLNSSLEYATIDPQTTNSEFISFTGITQNSDGTATLTGVTRGLSRSYPYTASATFQVTHSGQANLILSNPPQLYNDIYTYINNLSVAGSVDMTATIKGIAEESTALEASRHAADGSGNTTAPLALVSSIASSSRVANGPVVIVSSSTDGYIDDSFINITRVVPGLTTTAATSTFATTTIKIGSFPAYQIGKNSQIFSSTGTTTFTVPSGITKVHVRLVGAGGGGGSSSSGGAVDYGGGGGAGGYAEKDIDVTGTSTIQVFVGSGGAAASAGTWSTFGTNGFYISATGGNGGGTVATAGDFGAGGSGGVGSGGDFNSSGGGGTFGGGTSLLGGGGSFNGNVSGSGSNGGTGGNYGGGGAGSVSTSGGGGKTGGSGAQGIVIISW